MGILDRGLGHPASWLDVGMAWAKLQDHFLISLICETNFDIVVGAEVYVEITIRAQASAWSPHFGRPPIVKKRTWELGPNKPLSEGIYSLLWEVDSTAGIVLPEPKL